MERESPPPRPRLLVLYAPSLDRRRVTTETMPTLHRLMTDFPAIEMRAQPTNDMFSTLVTGTYPETHGIWEVVRKDDPRSRPLDRWLDRVPDWLSTTVQCGRYVFDRSYDLPTVPRRRRRHFEIRRLKLRHRLRRADSLDSIGDVPTLLGILGEEAIFVPSNSLNDIPRLLERLPTLDQRLQLVEFHAIDTLSHWHLDRPRVVRRALARFDAFLGDLLDQCRARGTTLVLLVDHGQGLVRSTIDLRRALRRSGVPTDEYHYLATNCDVRFWFETERARRDLTHLLDETPHLTVLSRSQHESMRVPRGRLWGELYAATEEGHIIFPNDYHHALGIRILSLFDRRMLRRVRTPHHRGTHGHLPDQPSERGYVLVVSDDVSPHTDRMELVDFAPTVLSLLGREVPRSMVGRPAFGYEPGHSSAPGSTRHPFPRL